MVRIISLLLFATLSTIVVGENLERHRYRSRSTQNRFDSLRINCGSLSNYTDPRTGNVWRADRSFVFNNKGRTVQQCSSSIIISNTNSTMKPIYCTHRWFESFSPPYEYRVPVPSTTDSYTVRLHFAEMRFRSARSRLMDVRIEGILYVKDLDIFAKVGYRSAYVYEVPSPITVRDGSLTINLSATRDSVVISGIEVLRFRPPTKSPSRSPTKMPTRLPSNTPTRVPSKSPTHVPSEAPTSVPSAVPTTVPSAGPTSVPSALPTSVPSAVPTSVPSEAPTNIPLHAPQNVPSETPSSVPITAPQNIPIEITPTTTEVPSETPTSIPTNAPTKTPTSIPTRTPTSAPLAPTSAPVSPSPFVYYSTNSTDILGIPDVNVAIGNPLKGLAGSPRWSGAKVLPNATPSAIEFYNVGLNEIMIGDNLFDWTIHDKLVGGSAQRKMHAVLSVYVHWPWRPLRLPLHLTNIPLYNTSWSGMSPNYGEPRLLEAYRQFIYAWAAHIDGDPRIAAIHVGLLGFWGEGHTFPDNHLTPDSSKRIVAQWYRDAFKKTKVQTRYPGENVDGFGLYDGSLAYNTLDGAANGGVNVGWFQYPRMVQAGQTNIWKKNMMGGETRPELQEIIFTNTYPARTENHQDFKECVDALHLSYVVHHGAFVDNGYSGDQLRNANKMHAYLGYAFYVSEISAWTTTLTNTQAVDLLVTVTQIGVAPFYYDLRLVFECGNGIMRKSLGGVDEIIDKGESGSFLFEGIPATKECLENVKISLESSYAYVGRPILFAQGTNGKVNIRLPVPGASEESPRSFIQMIMDSLLKPIFNV